MHYRLLPTIIILCVLNLFTLQHSAHSADSINLKLTGSLVGGVPVDVAIQGNYAYVAADSCLSILDISNPNNPTNVTYLPATGTWYAGSIAVNGNYAYLAVSDSNSFGSAFRLHKIDISSPASPSIVGTYYSSTDFATGIAVDGSYAYVIVNPSKLIVFDISPTTDPIYKSELILPGRRTDEIVINGNYAHIANGDKGIRIIDISTPATPTETGFYDSPGTALSVAVSASGQFAYLADDTEGLFIIDVSTPATPEEVAHLTTPFINTRNVTVSNNHVYVSEYEEIDVIDVTVPISPVYKGSIPATGSGYGDMTVNGNYLYKPGGVGGLQVVNISNPATPATAGFYKTPSHALDIAVIGQYAYVINEDVEKELQVINIAIPQSPAVTGTYTVTDKAYSMDLTWDLFSATAYIAADDYLEIVNITNPSTPALIGKLPLFTAVDVVVSGNYAYLADYHSGLRIVDISTPATPNLISTTACGTSSRGIDVHGIYAYVINSDGLKVINVSDPVNPVIRSTYAINTGGPEKVFVSGDYAYVAYSGAGLLIIDVSDPDNPSLAGTFTQNGFAAKDVLVDGNYAYVAGDEGGLFVLDVRNPVSPVVTGFHETTGDAYGIDKLNNRLYLANYRAGIQFFDYTPEGNLDNNSDLNLKDAILALQIIAGKTPASSVSLAADVNNDVKLGMAEAIYILKKISL